jgi:ferritin-like metal-binding protein YciE
MHDFHHLFIEQLRDIYDAENQLLEALPKMAQAAHNEKLSDAFEHHLEQTRQHVDRLEKVFDLLDESADRKTCEAMQGLIEEGEDIIQKDGDPHVKDAALIAAAQRVEHYEIAAYGTVCTYAEQMSHDEALSLLQETLEEEKDTDHKLNDLATGSINEMAES